MISAKAPETRLQHIINTIDGMLEATAGRSAEQIRHDFALSLALERAVQIVSEAAKELPAEVRDRAPEIPWANIIRIGNLLRHEYYRIQYDVLFEILRTDFPTLRAAALHLLGSLETPDET